MNEMRARHMLTTLFVFATAFLVAPYALQLEAQTQPQSPSRTAVSRTTSSSQTGRELLAQEPEIKAVGGLMDSWQAEQQKNPNDPTRQSNARIAFGGYVDLRNRMVIVDRLEERLQKEVVDHNFHADLQAELSELMREELAWEVAYQSMGLRTYDPIGDQQAQMEDQLRSHYGQPKLPDDPEKQRWTTLNTGYAEAGDIMKWHCLVQYPNGGPRLTWCQGQNSFGDRPTDSVFEMARSHEKAWASCFQHNNWVADGHRRLAYEGCMAKEDPLTKLCAADRKANPEVAEHSCPNSFVVHVRDIDHLLSWTDRYAGHAPAPYVPIDPAKATVEVFPERRLGVDIALLDPVVMRPQNEVVSIRGEVARDIPGSSLGDGAIVAVPKGTPAILQVQCYLDGANIYLLRLSLPNGANIDFKNQVKSFPAHPPAGYPGIPVPGQVLHNYALPELCKYSMLKSEFDRKAKEYAASLGINGSAGDFRHQRIYAKSILAVYMTQDLDLDSARAGAEVRGHMSDDITDYDAASHPDMLHVPHGADVYLKVTAKPSDVRPYMDMTVTPDYLVSRGLNIPLVAKPNVYRIAATEKPGSSTEQQRPDTTSSGDTSFPTGGVLGRLPKLGGIWGRVPRQTAPRTTPRREPEYENMRVVKTGALVMITTKEDTFVANATPATQPTSAQPSQPSQTAQTPSRLNR